jgi:GNAT superfamily N-acetyltransferase
MTSYSFERLSAKNMQDLIPIYSDAFGIDVSLDFLRAKQNTSFTGFEHVGFIAYDDQNQPVAFYGVYPCLIEFQGKKYLVAQSGDTMTHSKHVGKGLFTKLAQKTYEYCKENGFHLVFGFPNENSFPGFIKRLGWSHFDNMTPYLIRVKCIPWIRLKNTFKLPQSLHDRWCNFILNRMKKGNPFKSSACAYEIPVVDHSSEFFVYKTYAENYLINIYGINVWLKFDDTFLFIGDIEKCNETDFKKTIKALKKIAFKMGLPHLRFQTSSSTEGERLFQKFGQPMQVNYPVGGINFSGEIPLEKLKFTGADNDTF